MNFWLQRGNLKIFWTTNSLKCSLKKYEQIFNPTCVTPCQYFDEDEFINKNRTGEEFLNVFYLNIRSLPKHGCELLHFLKSLKTKFEVIVLTEIGAKHNPDAMHRNINNLPGICWYCFMPYIWRKLTPVHRVYIVWDVYKSRCLYYCVDDNVTSFTGTSVDQIRLVMSKKINYLLDWFNINSSGKSSEIPNYAWRIIRRLLSYYWWH